MRQYERTILLTDDGIGFMLEDLTFEKFQDRYDMAKQKYLLTELTTSSTGSHPE
jgi:hypothetical protein